MTRSRTRPTLPLGYGLLLLGWLTASLVYWSCGTIDTVGLVMSALVAAVFAGLAFFALRRDRQWWRFAQQHDGVFERGGLFRRPSVAYCHRGQRIVVDEPFSYFPYGRSKTCVKLPWSDRECRIEVREPLLSISKFELCSGKHVAGELQRVEIGQPGYDQKYAIYGNDARRVFALFNPAVQLAFDRLHSGNNRVDLSVRNGWMTLTFYVSVLTCKALTDLTEPVLDFYDKALETLSPTLRNSGRGVVCGT